MTDEAEVPWPWPGDTDTDKARRIAHDYRRELLRLDPDLCGRMDAAARRLGQHWIAPQRADLDLNAELTAAEMSRHLHGEITADRIRQWAARGQVPTIKRRGQTLYRVGDVLDVLAGQRIDRANRRAARPTTPAARQPWP